MLHDLRYALRTLRQSPGFALVAILSLALGIGANSAMFSYADALLLRPLPVPDSSAIVRVQSQLRGETLARFARFLPLSYPDYVDVRDKSRSFAGLTASQYASFGFATTKGALPEMKFGELVSGNFFSTLGVRPECGRVFTSEEDRVRGRDAVVVLGYDLWQTEFAASREAVGRLIYLNGIPFTVIGVAPQRFVGSNSVIHSALFVPLAMGPRLGGEREQAAIDQRDTRTLLVRGRLRARVSVAEAAAEIRVIGQQLSQAYAATNRTASLVTATDRTAQLQQDPYDAVVCFFLLALSVLVLLIACANVMNLMLSRARARSREIAIRLAIGAGRARLIRQLLTESGLIALLGGAAGLLVAQACADLFSQFRVPGAVPIQIDARLDARVLLFTLFASMASALLFGLGPALQTAHPELVPALKSSNADGGKRRRLLGRNGLVVAQVAGSLVLLVFATQAYRGAAMILSSPLGFRTDHVLVASFNPTLARYTPDQAREFYKHLLDRAQVLAGVKSAALAVDVPMGYNGRTSRVVPEGVQLPPGADSIPLLSNTVSDGYFETLGISILEGRSFQATDRAGSPRVAIVNELFARMYYPQQSAVGKRLRVTGADGGVVEIVGVAKRSKYAFVIEPAVDFLYLPASQTSETGMTLLLHTAGPPGDMASPLREAVRSLDASEPMFAVSTMEAFVDQRARKVVDMLIQVIAAMSLVGLTLALIGLYGLMTYSVGLRQREIGIRLAIGAEPVSVLKMVLNHGLMLAGSGILIGLALSLMAGRPLTDLLESGGYNLPLLALVATALLMAAALGAFLPAKRASLVDPNVVLRQE